MFVFTLLISKKIFHIIFDELHWILLSLFRYILKAMPSLKDFSVQLFIAKWNSTNTRDKFLMTEQHVRKILIFVIDKYYAGMLGYKILLNLKIF